MQKKDKYPIDISQWGPDPVMYKGWPGVAQPPPETKLKYIEQLSKNLSDKRKGQYGQSTKENPVYEPYNPSWVGEDKALSFYLMQYPEMVDYYNSISTDIPSTPSIQLSSPWLKIKGK